MLLVSDYEWLDTEPRIKLLPDPDRTGAYYFTVPARIVERTIIRGLEPFVSEVVQEIVLE
jgi:hypothetical protein